MTSRPPFRQTLLRGLRQRCPRCGEGPLFAGWNRLHEHCTVCGLELERRVGDTWFLMYMTTAGLTGSLVVAMFLIRPRVLWVGQVVVCLAAVVIIGLSLPLRKGIAVALDYWIEGAGEG
ncbi:MAG TPA: DUF983 domain-containing protein [Thermoanaerobaculia bacterium]|jgi:uncharacterized protein (DUF983 family)|nr:DUF983 domain-containing protein [Thermoanaerobaculia bacterium]